MTTSERVRRIDLATLRPNPTAGRTAYQMLGHIVDLPNGGQERRYHTVYSMCPEPAWLFQYELYKVTCSSCGFRCDIQDVGSTTIGVDEDGDDIDVDECPSCGAHSSFDDKPTRYETATEALQRQAGTYADSAKCTTDPA